MMDEANQGQTRPNKAKPRPTIANQGQPRPTKAKQGQTRPTKANQGQTRPTKANVLIDTLRPESSTSVEEFSAEPLLIDRLNGLCLQTDSLVAGAIVVWIQTVHQTQQTDWNIADSTVVFLLQSVQWLVRCFSRKV